MQPVKEAPLRESEGASLTGCDFANGKVGRFATATAQIGDLRRGTGTTVPLALVTSFQINRLRGI